MCCSVKPLGGGPESGRGSALLFLWEDFLNGKNQAMLEVLPAD